MDVDKNNFEQAYDIIHKLLTDKEKPCEFYAIDFEMTGIKGQPESYDDCTFERYLKYKRTVQKFCIIQTGLCLFRKVSDNEYESFPFNFYIIQRENKWKNPTFGCEAGAMEFNCKHNMDFNRWIYQGINYVQRNNIQKLEEVYQISSQQKEEEKEIEKSEDFLLKCNEEQVKRCQEHFEKMKNWLNNEQEKHVIIDEHNGFLRKIIYLHIEENYPELLIKQEENTKRIILQKASADEKKKYQEEKELAKKQKFDEIIGFTKLIDLLINSKLPLIGHNCVMDLLFLYNAFIGYLPNNFFDWKNNMHHLFPTIIDTKYLMKHLLHEEQKLSSTTLLDLYTIINQTSKNGLLKISCPQGYDAYDLETMKNDQQEQQQSIIIAEKIQEQEESKQQQQQAEPQLKRSKQHEAGFDSLLTGWVYKQLIYVKQLQEEQINKIVNRLNIYNSYFNYNLQQNQDDRINQNELFVLRTDEFDKNLSNFQVKEKTNKYKEQMFQCLKDVKDKFEIRIHNNFLLIIEFKENSQNIDWFQKIVEEIHKNKIKLKIQKYNDFLSFRLKSYQDDISKKKNDDEYD